MFRLRISLADRLFSLFIRSRDKFICQRCFKDYSHNPGGLHNSHFWGRGNKSVRFDPENAVALCAYCHQRFTANPDEHREFFMKRLGVLKYDALGVRARTPTKIDEKLIAMGLKEQLKRMGVQFSKKRGPALLGPDGIAA